MVAIILEDIHYSGRYLSPKDYPPILEEIQSLFPAEKNCLVRFFFCFERTIQNRLFFTGLLYYYFSRKTRKNPGGRLYNKFVNSYTKIRKTETLTNKTEPEDNSLIKKSQEYDVEI